MRTFRPNCTVYENTFLKQKHIRRWASNSYFLLRTSILKFITVPYVIIGVNVRIQCTQISDITNNGGSVKRPIGQNRKINVTFSLLVCSSWALDMLPGMLASSCVVSIVDQIIFVFSLQWHLEIWGFRVTVDCRKRRTWQCKWRASWPNC